jgi:hypothetical protein
MRPLYVRFMSASRPVECPVFGVRIPYSEKRTASGFGFAHARVSQESSPRYGLRAFALIAKGEA